MKNEVKRTEFIPTSSTTVDLILGDDEVGESLKKMTTEEISCLVQRLLSDLRVKSENKDGS